MQHFSLAIIGSGSGNVLVPGRRRPGSGRAHRVGRLRRDLPQPGLHPEQDPGAHGRRGGPGPHRVRFRHRRRGDRGGLAVHPGPHVLEDRPGLSRSAAAPGRESGHVTLFEGRAHFTGPHELVIDGDDPASPPTAWWWRPGPGRRFRRSSPTPGSSSGPPTTIMRIDELPASMVIVGGGHVAAEFAHVFSGLGVEIHLVNRAATLLGGASTPTSPTASPSWPGERWDVHLSATITGVRRRRRRSGRRSSSRTAPTVTGDLLLVAAGRQPDTDDLGLEPGRGQGSGTTGAIAGRRVRPDDGRGDLVARRRQLAVRAQARGQRRGPHAWPTTWPTRTTCARSRMTGCPSAVFTDAADRHRSARASRTWRAGGPTWQAVQDYRRHGLRVGPAGHHRLLQAVRRSRDRDAARRPHPGLSGLAADPAAGPGDVVRAGRSRHGPRPVLDPPRAERGRGERPAQAPARPATGRLTAAS